MQRLEVSGAVGPIYGSLGVKRLRIRTISPLHPSAFLRVPPRPCSDSGGHVASVFTTVVKRVRKPSCGQPFHVFRQPRCVTSADVT